MGWFKKDKEKVPELPRLPPLPSINLEEGDIEELPKLPSIPSSEIGNRFSQNMIKEAVIGEKEDEDVEEEIEEIESSMETLPHLPLTREIEPPKRIIQNKREIPESFVEAATKVKEEPVFIRIDKFEESLKIFEKTKERISEVDRMLRDIRKVREKEEQELSIWEEEIQNLKNQIEKVDQDIFSKIE
jgi:septation ring formation regulator EzrA|tara:strand:+ start:2997 stop:3557 length:561 start_codon:yes stop_codon:yes gene_type:complete